MGCFSVPEHGPELRGHGVEQETIQQLVNMVYKDEAALHFVPRYDDKLTFASSTDELGIPSSDHQVLLAGRAGALAGLSWLRLGRLPENFSALQIAFCLYEGDLRGLSRDLIRHFMPTFVDFIDRWRATGPDGDITWAQPMFISYLELDVSTSFPRLSSIVSC